MKRNFFKYVSLNVCAMIGLSLYILADTFFISQRLSANGLTALNLAIPIFNFISGLGLMLGIGGATKYAVMKARQEKGGNKIFGQALLLGLISGLIFSIIGISFSEKLSIWMGADSHTFDMTNEYLKTILSFSPLFILNNILVSFVRNDGSPQLSMMSMLIGSLTNIVLDYVFLFPLDMGMFGAALATATAPVVGMAILSIHFIKKNHSLKVEKSKLKLSLAKEISALGVSSLINEMSSGIVIILFNIVILSISGNIGVAAYGIIANISLVVTGIFTGIAQGIQPIVSYEYGSGKLKGLYSIRKMSLITSIITAVAAYALIFIFRQEIVSIFNSQNNIELAVLAEEGVKLYFTGFLFSGLNIVFASYLSAVEIPNMSFKVSIARGFVFLIPILFLLSNALGMNGVWLSYLITEVFTSICLLFFLNKSNLVIYKRFERVRNF
jgi:putative MATE family efflux protein